MDDQNQSLTLFVNAAQQLGLIGVGIVGTILANHRTVASLKVEKLLFEKENSSLQARVASLESQVAEEKGRYAQRFSDESIRAKYPFDPNRALHIRDGQPFCHKCLLEYPIVESPLIVWSEKKWKCRRCFSMHEEP